jgi:coenzyme F420 hydrogenase subunit beta
MLQSDYSRNKGTGEQGSRGIDLGRVPNPSVRGGLQSAVDVARHGMCQGCGACRYICPNQAVELWNVLASGIRPVADSTRCTGCRECLRTCSGLNVARERRRWPTGTIQSLRESWGPVLEVWEGHAGDPDIRFQGGSGGVVTALASYCLEKEGLYGTLHVKADPDRPHMNRAVLSRTRDALLQGAGSRYAPASPCDGLSLVEDAPAPCLFVGKPCDIAAAQKARRIRRTLDEKLGATIALFCGGTPSTNGTMELFRNMGIDASDVASLRYRGYGWPGAVRVVLKKSQASPVEMAYRQAWDAILTHHKPFRCHICPDGTGEFADLACGDPWYRPIREGEHGSSLIVVRTNLGQRILRQALETGYVVAERREPAVLTGSQASLLNRRRHVAPKLIALSLLGLPRPNFSGLGLWREWLRLPWQRVAVSFYRALRYAWSLRKRGHGNGSLAMKGEAEFLQRHT